MRYLLILLLFLQLSCSINSQELNHVPSKPLDLAGLKKLVNDGSKEKYTILYYSADYCPPCKKVKKVLDSKVSKASFKNIRLIEMNENDFENGTAHPVLAKYKIRVVPTFIHVDKDLNELGRNWGRAWKTKNSDLDKFIKDLWPDKTPEELKEEEDRKNQQRNSSRLYAALRQDTSLSPIARGFYQDEFFKEFEGDYKSNTLRIEKFNTFQNLVDSDFTNTKKLHLQFNRFSEEEQKQIVAAIPKFVNVEYLYFGGEQFLPDEIFELKKIKILFLNGGYDRITLSEKIVQLKELEHLKLGYSSIKLPGNIDQLKNLTSIMMPGGGLDQPDALFRLKHLKLLALKFNSAEAMPDLKNLKNLEYLETNHFIPEIASLTNLRTLKLNGSTVGDISNLKNLEVLSLYGSPAHEMNASVFSLPKLTALFIFTPYGYVTFPTEVSPSNSLKYVYISYNTEWPNIEVPTYLRKANHYVEYVRK